MKGWKIVSFLLVLALVGHGDVFADLNNGLVAYYPFNGNARDASGNGIHGIVAGAALVKDRNGFDNRAYYFDGDDYIAYIPHPNL